MSVVTRPSAVADTRVIGATASRLRRPSPANTVAVRAGCTAVTAHTRPTHTMSPRG